ncbi:FKBP-type peptidyl-prolyl cis-trans isomerase [Butyrivibrio fibrisolvens]|uniref:FKBP-type peptidyl-prolyl cis-trans isomerase n=1 Tax=Pseudobutyrivibrio ruminis TaxID=46206 RepID=UPI000401A310|nr:FKBP-type peptidyl-prolyl cis-trans isomerase [Pseudobutyrivibrio ruminis]MDC7280195.1 FKBP-type peptidyl-prolyl cis-trans isomerase [Butyrivibrio fibrisolvens]
MKNRFLVLILVGALAFSFTACGSKEEEKADTKTEQSADKKSDVKPIEYDVDEFVTLGDYKGLDITLDGEYEYTDKGFDEYVSKTISEAAIYVEDSSAKEIAEDSIVNVDYVGSQDGVAFDGGSAEDQLIDIGNNSSATGGGYISGFTSGLVGHKVGEEVAYEVTFPQDYGNADLAGQTVIFTFQVNYIAKAIDSKEALTDEIVSDKFGYDTVDAYMDALKEQYTASLENNLKSDKQTAVLNAVLNNSKVSKVPEDLLQARVDMYLSVYDKQYQSYGTTAKEYFESMGQDYDAYVESMKTSIQESTETELILEAIAKAEGIEIDEAGYKEFIQGVLSSSGTSDETSFYEVYDVDGYTGERYFRQAYLTQKALDFCIDNANYTGAPAEAE